MSFSSPFGPVVDVEDITHSHSGRGGGAAAAASAASASAAGSGLHHLDDGSAVVVVDDPGLDVFSQCDVGELSVDKLGKMIGWRVVKRPAAFFVDTRFNETCTICFDDLKDAPVDGPGVAVMLPCNHSFHANCLLQQFDVYKKAHLECAVCKRVYGGVRVGNMPDGVMKWRVVPLACDGYQCPSIEIRYEFPDGVQGPHHPNPGRSYSGTVRDAFLPDNPDGRRALGILLVAFQRRHTFTVGRSITTGRDNTTVWNLHHKTSPSGGLTNFGYPDQTYFTRLEDEANGFAISLHDLQSVSALMNSKRGTLSVP